MEIKTLPLHLSEITLEQYIGWNNTYGQELLKKSKRLDTEDAKLLFQDEFYTKHYAWFSSTPWEEVRDLMPDNIDTFIDVLKMSAESLMCIQRELIDIQEIDVVNSLWGWNDYFWKIQPPVVVEDESKVTLAEFEKVQDVALILSDLQDGRIEALLELCATYLVLAVGDKPVIELDYTGKCEMMKQLPLNIAKCVQKYIQDTVNLYKLLKDAANNLSATP